jgi:ComF family protein
MTWHLDHCDGAVDYQYPWSMCVSRFKYGAQVQLARPLAQLLALAPYIEDALEHTDWIIPIPIAKERLAQRGFNQAEQLAHHLSKHHRHKILRYALQRLDDHAQQAGASKGQRLRNIQGVFTTNPTQQNALKGKRIVLIDDVLTTGATLNEAALTLKQAGALSVQAVVFARTPPKPT